MSETSLAGEAAEQQKAATALFGNIINSGADPLLKAQADVLESVEATMTGWLRRRHEAVVETQQLVARLRATSDPSEYVTVQQEWISGAFRRLSADATAYQTAAQHLVDRARTWFPQTADGVAEVTNGAAAGAEAATPNGVEAGRIQAKPLRVANKAS